MAVYSVEGKLGTGKTKFAVWRAQQALRAGRRVASNVDLELAYLTPERGSRYVRVPDHPTAFDLEAIGHGNPESYDEDKNGILILDELGTWLNARSFQDKARAGVLDWFLHARKHGWDVYLIVQDASLIDKQVRAALIEYECRCVRLDKVRIPVVGKLLGVFGGRIGYLPRMHLVTARVGEGAVKLVAEKWIYRGDDLHQAYDTRQIFRADYEHGTHSVLPTICPLPRLTWRNLGARAWGALAWQLRVRLGMRQRPKIEPRAKRPEVAAVMALPPDQRIAALRADERGH